MKAKWILVAIVVGLIAAAAAAYGGYSYGMQTGQTQAANVRAGFLAGRGLAAGGAGGTSGALGQGSAGFGQGGGPQFNSANFTSGQVKQIDGNTLQISTPNEVVTVKISDKTQIQKMGQASLADIQPGERLTVQGTKGADGTFTAQMIQVGGRGAPSGAPGGAPAGAPGGGAAAPNAAPTPAS